MVSALKLLPDHVRIEVVRVVNRMRNGWVYQLLASFFLGTPTPGPVWGSIASSAPKTAGDRCRSSYGEAVEAPLMGQHASGADVARHVASAFAADTLA